MNKKELSINTSSSMFVASFFICQLFVLIINIFAIVIGAVLGYNTTDLELFFSTAVGYLICAMALYLGMTLCFLFCKKNYEFKTFSKPNTKKILFYSMIAIISFFALYPIIVCFDNLLIKSNIPINTIPYDLTTTNYFISLISLCLLPAVCEELLFRGVIQSGLNKCGKRISIMVTSAMFAIFHMSISQIIYPVLFGILLSGIMYKESNILYTIIMHAINNFLSLTISYFNIPLVFNHWSYILIAFVLLTVWLVFISIFIKKIHIKTQIKITKQEAIFLATSFTIMIILWIINLISSL